MEIAAHFDCCDPQRLHIRSFIVFLLIQMDCITFSTDNYAFEEYLAVLKIEESAYSSTLLSSG